jgi:hypothetical protein
VAAHNKGGRWCSDGEMVPGVRGGDWSRGGCSGECGALGAFYRVVRRRKADGRGEGGSGGGTSMAPVTGDENREGDVMGCGHFRRGRGGGGEAAPRCGRQTTQRRAAWRLASGG